MWGLIADQDTKDRIKAMAYEKYLENRSRTQWFDNYDFRDWFDCSEDEFKEKAKCLFAPKVAKDEEENLLNELEIQIPKNNKKRKKK